MKQSRTPPWLRPNPKVRTSQPLSAAQKEAARQRAQEHGRPYPNLVDNIWASRLPRGD